MARDPVNVALNAARRAGWFPDPNMMRIALAAVTPLIREEERERCAQVAARYYNNNPHGAWAPLRVEIAAAIRALASHPREASGVVSPETGNVRDSGGAT